MKLSTPEIVWHGKEPIFSADFHKNGPKWRLATGGADNDIKIWKIENGQEGIKIVFLSNLSRHTKAVNVVRFSPDGKYLASAGDDNVLFIWSKDMGGESEGNNLLSDTVNKENWSVVKVLRGHLEDVYDLCWSCDSCSIISGSVDNSAIVWDVQTGQQVNVLRDSRQYVQGVSWDPLGKFVVTISNDRNLRIYGVENKFKCLHSVTKMSTPNSNQQDGDSKQWRMWIDERLNSFFRRLSFTPDGLFLIVPAGRFEVANQSKNATYVFARNNWSRPLLQLPGPDKPTVVVKCCPVPFALKKTSECSITSLPYRLVYAVASLDSILFYDTQHLAPFAHVSNIHYSGITDLAWSNDGLMLLVTSSDCYCSIITFEPDELGSPQDSSIMCSSTAVSNKTEQTTELDQDTRDMNKTSSPAPLSGEPVSPSSKPRRIRPTMISTIQSSPCNMQTNSTEENNSQQEAAKTACAPFKCETVSTSGKKVPRRVELITLSSFNSSHSGTQQSSADQTESNELTKLRDINKSCDNV